MSVRRVTQDLDVALKVGPAHSGVQCTGECSVTVTLTMAGPAAKALGLTTRTAPVVIGSGTLVARYNPHEYNPDWRTRPGTLPVLEHFTRAAKAKIAAATKPVVFTQAVVAKDQVGTRKFSRTVVLKP